MTSPPDDFSSLMRELREGSDTAACQLLHQYGDCVLRAVRRKLNKSLRGKFDSQDFVQSVWAAFFEHRQKISELESPEGLIAFLVRVAGNKVTDECRKFLQTDKHNVNRQFSIDSTTVKDLGPFIQSGPSPSQVAQVREQWARLNDNQPSHYRRIIQLRGSGATYPEIAEQLGVNEKTVRRVLQKLTQQNET